jgi:hypothetical protein
MVVLLRSIGCLATGIALCVVLDSAVIGTELGSPGGGPVPDAKCDAECLGNATICASNANQNFCKDARFDGCRCRGTDTDKKCICE